MKRASEAKSTLGLKTGCCCIEGMLAGPGGGVCWKASCNERFVSGVRTGRFPNDNVLAGTGGGFGRF